MGGHPEGEEAALQHKEEEPALGAIALARSELVVELDRKRRPILRQKVFFKDYGRGANPSAQPSSRGSSSLSVSFAKSSPPTSRSTSPAPTSHKDFMNSMTVKFQELKQKREEERARAIRDGVLADPEKKTSLDKAITPVGTCTEMCPAFERIERIVQNMVDRVEKVSDESTGRAIPSEDRMIKRFKRSAAGDDEQLPSDIRTPATLVRTLDFLLDKIIGGDERLAAVHKFVWDRTRSIRNDFSIQQVSKVDDVKFAVQCFERIARFHILSLHQLSSSENLLEGENFDAHQEREQLNRTLLSLMYYYDDHRDKIVFQHEAEFRSYCILLELQTLKPDLEERMHSWPQALLADGRVKAAFTLYAAAADTLSDQGPLQPMTPFSIAQGTAGKFWEVLQSKSVSYLMACVAEIYFGQVRFAALSGLWRSAKSHPASMQGKNQDWTVHELTWFLGFDSESQTVDFCQSFNLTFSETDGGAVYLNITNPVASLNRASLPTKQIFSDTVEGKRYRRTFVAVVNGVSVAQAIRTRLIEPQNYQSSDEEQEEVAEDAAESGDEASGSLFMPEQKTSQVGNDAAKPSPFNLEATSFDAQEGAFATPKPVSTANGGFGSLFGSSSSSFNPFVKPGSLALSSSITDTIPSDKPTSTPVTTGQPPGPVPTGFQFPAPAAALQPSSENLNSWFSPPAFSSAVTPAKPEFQPSAQATSQFFDTGPPPGRAALFGKTLLPNQVPLGQVSDWGSHLPDTGLFGTSNTSKSQVQAPAPPQDPAQTATTEHSQPLFQFMQHPPTTSHAQNDRPNFGSKPSGVAPHEKPSQYSQASAPIDSAAPRAHSAQPPPIAQFNFSSGPQQPAIAAATAQVQRIPEQAKSALVSPISGQPSGTPKIQLRQPSVQAPTTSSSPSSPTKPQPQPTPAKSPLSPEDAIDIVARLGLQQPRGLLQQFVEFYLSETLNMLTQQHYRSLWDASTLHIRRQYLINKYGRRWHGAWQRKNRFRKSEVRRAAYEDILRKHQENVVREEKIESERREIIQAQRIKGRIQEEQRKTRLDEERRQTDLSLDTQKKADTKADVKQYQKNQEPDIRRKRKSIGDLPEVPRNTPRKILRTTLHRCLKSQACTPQAFDKDKIDIFADLEKKPQRMIRNLFSGQPHNGYIFPLEPSKRRDRTTTDHFKLKALGYDPDTPVVPHTTKSLAAVQREEKLKRRAAMMPPRVKRGAVSTLWNQQLAEWEARDRDVAEEARMKYPTKASDSSRTLSASSGVSQEQMDEWEKSTKEMQEMTQWLRSERMKMETAEKENLRRGQESQNSIHNARLADSSGLIMVNGYKVRPFPTSPGKALNRMEQRIMKTGGRGLYTAPIPGTPEYESLARSKYNRLRHSLGISEAEADQLSNSPPLEKGLLQDVLSPVKASSDGNNKVHGYLHKASSAPTSFRTGNVSHHNATTAGSGSAKRYGQVPLESLNPKSRTVNDLPDDRIPVLGSDNEDEELLLGENPEGHSEEESEAAEEELLEDNSNNSDSEEHDRQDGSEYEDDELDHEDYEEDEEEDDDQEAVSEDELLEDDFAVNGLQSLAKHAYLDVSKGRTSSPAATTMAAMEMSRATSGTGASADDAFVLSDSD